MRDASGCTGSILTFVVGPSPTLGHRADDCLPAGLDCDPLDPDHLAALAAVAVERLEQGSVGPRQLGGGAQVQLPGLDSLLGEHGPAVALEARGVAGDHLADQHALEFVLWLGPDQGIDVTFPHERSGHLL
jgi:hypothetical protein